MTKSNAILLCLTFSLIAIGQNLIPNPSFEKAKPEPTGWVNDFNNFTCEDWSPINTTDYFTSKRTGFYSHSSDFGKQIPVHGNSYIGLNCYNPGQFSPEYAQVQLKEKLVKGISYCLFFYINMRDKSSYSVNEFDYLLSKEKIIARDKFPIISKDYKRIVSDSFIVEKEKWLPICSYYKAKGNEEFLTLGIFNENIQGKDLYDKFTNRKIIGAYYFIDSVSLFKINYESECECGLRTQDPDKPVVLSNINFIPKESVLLPSSFKGLDSIARYLVQNPTIKIKLSGHTDNLGVEDENIKLSASRAKAVADYLVSKGVSAGRISHKGYGSSIPLKPNDGEKNRTLNRRVELMLIK